MEQIQLKFNIGKIKSEPLSNLKYSWSWVIRNYFSLPQELDWFLHSPAVTCFGADWWFIISPRGLSSHETKNNWVTLGLLKDPYRAPTHRISCKMSIEKRDGTEYVSYSPEEFFDGNNTLVHSRVLHRSRLLQDETEIMPNGHLTIICALKAYDGKTDLSDAEVSREIRAVAVKEDSKTDCNLADKKETLPNRTGIFKLAQNIKELLLSGSHFDTTIEISDREFRVHRAILSSRSPVFGSMFCHDTFENCTGVIKIEDCNPDVFLEFLSFLYSGVLEKLSSENVLDLYIVADKYDVQEVKDQCLEFMTNNMSVDNFCDVIALALLHSESRLLETATEFFVQNAKEIAVTPKWLSFHKEYPVESNELYIKSLENRDRN